MENFGLLVRRMRRGDAHAAEELVRLYEADLRIIARARLFDPRLRQFVDSMDKDSIRPDTSKSSLGQRLRRLFGQDP